MSVPYRGVPALQDPRFINKQKQLQKSVKFPQELSLKVDFKKIRQNMNIFKEWITKRMTELLGTEDDVCIQYIFNLLEQGKETNPKELQINLTTFLGKNTTTFMKELWVLFHSASENEHGIPQQFLDAKHQELQKDIQRKQIGTDIKDRIQNRTDNPSPQKENQDKDRANIDKVKGETRDRSKDKVGQKRDDHRTNGSNRKESGRNRELDRDRMEVDKDRKSGKRHPTEVEDRKRRPSKESPRPKSDRDHKVDRHRDVDKDRSRENRQSDKYLDRKTRPSGDKEPYTSYRQERDSPRKKDRYLDREPRREDKEVYGGRKDRGGRGRDSPREKDHQLERDLRYGDREQYRNNRRADRDMGKDSPRQKERHHDRIDKGEREHLDRKGDRHVQQRDREMVDEQELVRFREEAEREKQKQRESLKEKMKQEIRMDRNRDKDRLKGEEPSRKDSQLFAETKERLINKFREDRRMKSVSSESKSTSQDQSQRHKLSEANIKQQQKQLKSKVNVVQDSSSDDESPEQIQQKIRELEALKKSAMLQDKSSISTSISSQQQLVKQVPSKTVTPSATEVIKRIQRQSPMSDDKRLQFSRELAPSPSVNINGKRSRAEIIQNDSKPGQKLETKILERRLSSESQESPLKKRHSILQQFDQQDKGKKGEQVAKKKKKDKKHKKDKDGKVKKKHKKDKHKHKKSKSKKKAASSSSEATSASD